MSWQLSDNGLKAVQEIGKWVMALIAVLGLWVQQHNQHIDRMHVEAQKVQAIDAQTTAIKAALDKKPLVFGEKQ